eukprot:Blabericola_migrator_1__4100@NODE_224_length_11141_cov_42_071880_g190_i0_p11_GENE_NODE_224_length_11141_cov_42_071880_g190_i0NODE_224_length_11141_cov_42_071880_g190_i0_p11_ORF_typecomplete_len147_score17_32_NODE_224_length_11141_cov_42_071880_g190_i056726112
MRFFSSVLLFLSSFCVSNGDSINALRFATVMLKRDISDAFRTFLFRYILEKDVLTTTLHDSAIMAEAIWRVEKIGESDLSLKEALIWTDHLFARECKEVSDYAFCLKIRDLASLWLIQQHCASPESELMLECDRSRYRAIDAWQAL